MNDRGLVLDWALCPQSDPPKFSFQKKIATFSLPDNLLAECATVDEAFNILSKLAWKPNWKKVIIVTR